MNWTPGPDNSNLINTEKAVPTKPANKAKIRYKVPISLAFVDKNHLSSQRDTLFKNKEFCLEIFEGFWCVEASEFSLGLHNCARDRLGQFTICFNYYLNRCVYITVHILNYLV